MIKTQIFNSDRPDDLEIGINTFLFANNIGGNELIDIKFSSCYWANKEMLIFSALIIYNEKSTPFAGKKSDFKIHDPYEQEAMNEEIPF